MSGACLSSARLTGKHGLLEAWLLLVSLRVAKLRRRREEACKTNRCLRDLWSPGELANHPDCADYAMWRSVPFHPRSQTLRAWKKTLSCTCAVEVSRRNYRRQTMFSRVRRPTRC